MSAAHCLGGLAPTVPDDSTGGRVASVQPKASQSITVPPEPYWAQYYFILHYVSENGFAIRTICLVYWSASITAHPVGSGPVLPWHAFGFRTFVPRQCSLVTDCRLSPTAGVRILLHGRHVSTIKLVKQISLPLMFAEFVFFPSALL